MIYQEIENNHNDTYHTQKSTTQQRNTKCHITSALTYHNYARTKTQPKQSSYEKKCYHAVRINHLINFLNFHYYQLSIVLPNSSRQILLQPSTFYTLNNITELMTNTPNFLIRQYYVLILSQYIPCHQFLRGKKYCRLYGTAGKKPYI